MMRRDKYNNIVKAARLLSLVVLMAFGAGLKGWGQVIVPTLPEGDEASLSGSTEIIYAMPGKNKDIYFQYAYVPDNLNGFIWWRLQDGTNDLLQTSGQLSDSQNGYYDYSTLSTYRNGFAWFRGKDGLSNIFTIPASACMITYKTPVDFTENTVICDASSLTNYSVSNNTITTPLTTIRRKYVIKNAIDRRSEFNTFRETVSRWKGGSDWLSKTSNNLPESFLINKSSFPENYEIHTPMVSDDGTSYRLAQILSNYYVGENDVPVKYVRWRMYDKYLNLASGVANKKSSDGVTVLHQEVENFAVYRNNNPANIINYKFNYDENNTDKQQIFYITAEVSSDEITWYPVSFLTVYLEPNATPVPKTTLNSRTEYEFRRQEYINARYTEIAKQDFDDVSKYANVGEDLLADTNYPDHPLVDAQSYYAYAYPNKYKYRANNLRSVGSGEYGIYRTLNYTLEANDISDAGWYTAENYGQFNYQAWFTNNYNYYITDRLYDEERKYGNFLYVDAADEAGVITKLSFSESLCPNTRLVVTAWVCSMSENRDGRTDADLGLTFKGVKSDDTEVILHKFYTGSVTCNPTGDNGYWSDAKKAYWQQVYFSFNFSANEDAYKNFILEIANNCRHSDGADYAIDDIRVYRSVPNIKVHRWDACDASTLTISSDFETLLRNMDWTENVPVVDANTVIPDDLKKYRFGLNGSNPENPITENYVGNTYFAFIEGLMEDVDGNVINDPNDSNYPKKDVTDYSLSSDKDPDPIVLSKGSEYRWVRINKNLIVDVPISRYSFRAVVSTVKDNSDSNYRYPTSQIDAEASERILNFRAVNDYNYAVQQWKEGKSTYKPDPAPTESEPAIIEYDSNLLNEENLGALNPSDEVLSAYSVLVETLYERLQIPRIRCPWVEGENLHLYTLNVDNTDLKYRDEIVGYKEDNTTPIKASGEYHVMLFSATQVENWTGHWDNQGSPSVNVADPCNLISSFVVQPSQTIVIDTKYQGNTALCLGAWRKITAELNFYTVDGVPTNKPDGFEYIFDWYLSPLDDYESEVITYGNEVYTIKDAIEAYRKAKGNASAIIESEIESWTASGLNEQYKNKLIELFKNGKLQTGATGTIPNEPFDLLVEKTQIVAIPYIINKTGNYIYCTDVSNVDLPVSGSQAPELHLGFSTVAYPFEGEVPLRLGHVNMDDKISLEIPVRNGFKDLMAPTATRLGIPTGGAKVSVYDNTTTDYPEVGEVESLSIEKEDTNANIVIKLNNPDAKTKLKEGQAYELLIPFVQYGDVDNDGVEEILSGECDGLISLPVKIVPEYLTWNGKSTWYNDENAWTISTKKELYSKSDVTNEEKNVYSFSPLYFTKITIPDGMELPLYDEASQNSIQNNQPLNFSNMEITSGTTSNIEYDMAVYSVDGGNSVSVKPYYGNLVSEIYFKPKALLKNQQYLNYKKAWVEFEMKKGEKYWLSSPLKDVFAGDMYAPTGTGRQTTPAFTDITYTDITVDGNYDRWNPAFYQKAWDKGVTYYTEFDGSKSETVSAVKSNWSIEYNDVNVPYSLGKGFYASVEGDLENDTALVRLPKADNNYSYYTKAATISSIKDRTYAGKLAGQEDVVITLIDKDDADSWYDETEEKMNFADGDGRHFLIGNPYMYPLNMQAFFDGNQKDKIDLFERKYWVLNNGVQDAVVVGTPDVGFGENTGTIEDLGQIPPMTAFFVELKESLDAGAQLEVNFTTDMMADNAETTRSVETKSLTASNPILTLTAERGETRSVARLLTSDKGHDEYEASEDAVILLDSELDAPMVYTVAGDVAAQFNTMQSIKNVPLGVYADKGEEVELTIRGISQFAEKLYLYDAVTKQSTPLDDDSYTFRVTGPSHGRFTLTSQNRISAESDICVYSPTPGQLLVMSSPEEPLQRVQVYDMSGRKVTSRDNIRNTTCQLTVPSGIYVVYAENETGNVRVKVRVR